MFQGELVGAHIGRCSVRKAFERTRAALEIPDLTVHDLRRTAGTTVSRLGVPRDVRERVLNHGGKRAGDLSDSVCNRYEFEGEKRAAVELWVDAVDAILGRGPKTIDSYLVRLARQKGGETMRMEA